MANRKERSPIGWFLLGLFFLALGVIAAYLVPVKHPYSRTRVTAPVVSREKGKAKKKRKEPMQIKLERCSHCGASIPEDAQIRGVCESIQD